MSLVLLCFTTQARFKVFFTPFHNVKDELLHLIKHETAHIQFALYYLTERSIVDALKEAQQRGVIIEAIIDQESFNGGNNGKAEELVKSGMDIVKFETAGMFRALMHNKFFIFENTRFLGEELYLPLVWTGSYNCTARANRNCENVLVTDDQEIVGQYKIAFALLRTLIASGIYTKGVLAEDN